jgi:hypothetical protein
MSFFLSSCLRGFCATALAAVALNGCSTPGATDDDANDSTEGALSVTDNVPTGSRRAELSRVVSPERPLPKDTPIGKKIADLLEQAKQGHEPYGEAIEENGCRQVRFIPQGTAGAASRGWDRDHTGEVVWKKCSGTDPSETVWISRGKSLYDFDTFADESGDGLVDSVTQPFFQVRDRNADGRVDYVREFGERLKMTYEAYPGWAPPAKPTRILEDTDDSGGLDKETVEAAGSWWRKL